LGADNAMLDVTQPDILNGAYLFEVFDKTTNKASMAFMAKEF